MASTTGIEPGDPDRGQPTHFQPRRNRHVFRVRVPADFGDQELVWTLTSHGETERAYGTLHPDYFLNDIAIMNNNGAGGPAGGAYNIFGNERPVLEVEDMGVRRATVGEPVVLRAQASDDGVPKRRNMPAPRIGTTRIGAGTPNSASGLRVAWIVYRGAGGVTFDPPQFKVYEDHRAGADSPWAAGWKTPEPPEDGTWVVGAAFHEPGTYVLRGLAHDGGLATHQDVTVTGRPVSSLRPACTDAVRWPPPFSFFRFARNTAECRVAPPALSSRPCPRGSNASSTRRRSPRLAPRPGCRLEGVIGLRAGAGPQACK